MTPRRCMAISRSPAGMPRTDRSTFGVVTCLILAAALAGGLLSANAEDALPSSLPAARYTALRERSPFALATAAAPVAPQASFASNWYVTGVARIDDNYYVTIKGRDLATQFTLFGNESVGGVSLASVNWSEQIGKSTVILRKGTETARLEFNEAQLRVPAAGTAGASPAPSAKPGGVAAAPAAPPMGVNMAAAANIKRRSLPIPVPR